MSFALFSPIPSLARKAMFSFDTLSTEHGLTNLFVTRVLQDREGFIWVATQDGLFRYDGYEFKPFRHDPGDPTSIADNYIQNLYLDHDGILWISSWRGGVARYHAQKESFTRYRHNPEIPESLSSDEVAAILVDRDGMVWIATFGGGLNRFDRNSGLFTHFRHSQEDRSSIGDDHLYTVFEDHLGTIWIGTRDGGLNRLERQTGTFIRYQHDALNPHSISHNRVTCILERSDGLLWIGTRGGGLNLLDRQTGTFQHFRHSPHDPGSLSSDDVFELFADKANSLWVGTHHGGLNRFNRDSGSFDHYLHDPLDKNSLSDNDVWSISQDQDGLLWLGTFGGGICTLDPNSESFGLMKHEADHPDRLSKGNVHAVFKDDGGVHWIGTDSGLDRYDPQSDQFRHYRHDPSDPKSLGDDHVSAIFADATDHLWIGTRSGGLNQLNQDESTFTQYRNNVNDICSLSDDQVLAIHQDSSGVLWIGTANGLNRYVPKSKSFVRYVRSPDSNMSISHNAVYALFTDQEGVLWIGTRGGLNRFNRQQETFTRYLHDPNNANSLSHNTVYSIGQRQAGFLWIGTNGGLNRFNTKSGSFDHYREKEGLYRDRVFAVLPDSSGLIWLGGDGISVLDPETGSIRNHVGIQAHCDRANQGAYFLADDGQLFFGGDSSYCAFFPEQVIRAILPPRIVFSDFRLLNKSVPIGDADHPTPLDQVINHTRTITLTHKDPVFSIEFAALSFINPKNSKYQYKLEGFNEGWVETDSDNRRATFTNLKAGDYTFRVKASNHEGIWNEEGRTLKLHILPSPWLSKWAYGIYLLSILGFLFTVHRIRVRYLFGVEQVRTGIARNLHDEVGATLTNIRQNAELIGYQTQRPERVEEKAHKISELSHQAIQSFSDIVWALDRNKDMAQQLGLRIKGMLHLMLLPTNTQWHFVESGFREDTRLDPAVRQQVYLITKEALNNIVKHSKASHVQLELHKKGRYLHLIIEDNGTGMDLEKPCAGHGISNMVMRAKSIGYQVHFTSDSGLRLELKKCKKTFTLFR